MKRKAFFIVNNRRKTYGLLHHLSVFLLIAFVAGWAGFNSSLANGQDIIANQPGRVTDFNSHQTHSHSQPNSSLPPTSTGRTPIPGTSGGASADWLSDEMITQQLANQAKTLAESEDGTKSTLRAAITVALVGLAPVVLLMTTCYIRLFVVLGLLRQALGVTQLPSNQMLTVLSFFVTILVMSPVWLEIKTTAIDPATAEDGTIDWQFAFEQGLPPIKRFMTNQIEATGNRAALEVFYQHQHQQQSSSGEEVALPENLDELPVHLVLPAFLISELKVAFLLGFQIFLPFLILDLVVSTLTVSMGMVMLPPTMVSLPLKLILFVMVDGWNLVVGMLLQSFGTVF